MTSFEQYSDNDKQNIRQVLAEEQYRQDMPDKDKERTFGPPNPENYKNAEKILDDMISTARVEKDWSIVIGTLRKALAIWHLQGLLADDELNAAFQSPFKNREPFFTALKANVLKRLSESKELFLVSKPVAAQIENLKMEADELHQGDNSVQSNN